MTGRVSRLALILLPVLLLAGAQVGAALVLGSRDEPRFRYPLYLREEIVERCEALAQRQEVRADACGCVLDEFRDTTPPSEAGALVTALRRHAEVPARQAERVEAAFETCS